MTFTIPSAVATGEMMLLVIGCYGSCATPSGWTLQSGPVDAANRNLYVFSRNRAQGDSTVTATISGSDSQTGTLIGIKNGSTVHRSAQVDGSVSINAGTPMPSVTTNVANTLNLWIAYSNSASASSDQDFSWSPEKTRAAVVIAPVAGTYYGVLSVVFSTQASAGASEAVNVIAPVAGRALASLGTIAIAQ